LIISPSATSETLSTIDGDTKSDESPGRFWRTVASDALQARVLALVVSMKGRSNLGFVYENSVYGAGFIAIMEDALPSTISSMRYPYNVGDRDTAESQRELAGMSMHDGIVFISSDISDLTGFLDEIEMDEAYQGQFLFFADGAADSAFLESTIQLLDTGVQIFGSRPPLLDGALFNNFEAIYRLKADAMGFPDLEASEDVYAAYTYDATWMALYGYAWAYFQEDPFTFDGLARGLRKLSNIEEDTVDVGFSSWNTIQTKFSSGTAVNIRGASGELDFQPATEELDSNVEIWSLGSTYSCFALNYVCTSDLACIEAEPSMDCP
jgi:branched-chain amino acid transport system substrate-binding protein